MSYYFYEPCYKIKFWSGSSATLRHGFGYGYNNKEVVSFKIHPGLTKSIGSFEIVIADTGSADGLTTGTAFSDIDVFDVVYMWYGYTGSGLTPPSQWMFSGRIDTKEVEFSENGCLRTFIGRDFGEPLLRTLQRRMFTGSISGSVVLLKEAAGLADDDTFISGSDYTYDLVLDNNSCFDGLMELADFDNKDFYVISGSQTLRWFPRQSYADETGTEFIEGVNILNYKYTKDLGQVKNDIYVFGIRDTSCTGSDIPVGHDDWTESDTGSWTSTCWSGSNPPQTITVESNSSYYATGSSSIYALFPENSVSGQSYCITFYRTFPKIMINSGDILHFYYGDDTSYEDNESYEVRLETDSSNYFYTYLEPSNYLWQGAGKMEKTLNLGPTAEGASVVTGSPDTNTGSYVWLRYGNPDWYNINAFRLLHTWTATGVSSISLYIDGLYFGVPFQYYTGSTDSIVAYGRRTEVIRNNRINSQKYAENYATTILNDKKDPVINITLDTLTRPYEVGTKYPIEIKSESIDGYYELIDVVHKWSDNKLISSCTFTNQSQTRVPIPITSYEVQEAVREKSWWETLWSSLIGLPWLSTRK